ncbi:Next to BRCA1 gene 1 protein [Grifola frondosa]|uniref:Next to BRCA1 gene 1 protein n=1 Tax=Grifola frondosa TaxID=5627 RepID=A0A1C7MSI2_GRIFR|nr:Next to BRCA1 gene 1 protein [Grifola frondosa]
MTEDSSPLTASAVPADFERFLPRPIEWPSPVPVEERLVDIDDVANENDTHDDTETTLVPRLGPVAHNEWRDFWPEMTAIFKNVLQPTSPTDQPAISAPAVGTASIMPGGIFTDEPDVVSSNEPASRQASDVSQGSPLVGEPLLCRPQEPEIVDVMPVRRRLSQLVLPRAFNGNEIESLEAVLSSRQTSMADIVPPAPAVISSPALFASFLSDNNIPDGQIFPPGAEFVKSWRMVNSGSDDWPETTELVFVGGDRMAPRENAPAKFKVGVVKVGDEVEIVAGDMKAPEVPGKYVSSWRLSDGEGNLFGHSIWVDITVAEVDDASSSCASSLVIMPRSAPHLDSARSTTLETVGDNTSTFSLPVSSAALTSSPRSDNGSLVDVPSLASVSSFSDDDDVIYEDSRSNAVVSPSNTRETEYVLLYDSASSEDD